ncbi:nucleic acid-binding protein [Aspergillus sclerotioniger CBS 115572]|uniref:Nucleic acid-binding protein n=1 Tax=Aspergillus sclerotioniger CBS 115572 TaxID=1450535 RepID=A0A317WYJ7_9EURO|nr:nucleic acid-binding protein [Aspergillus sclerotioniger CBS 115572]PWY91443.1 nucleic acid-binding protein [Aspergillus sclerotioniger CBS 115572]
MSAFMSSLRPALRASSGAALSARSFSSSSSRSVARLMITGRLAAQPELQATSSGQEVVKYTVASSHGPKDRRQTSWFKVSAFVEGNQREYITNLQQGTLVFVEGDASIRQWEDAEGKRQSALSIVQRAVEVLKRPYSETSAEHDNNN